MDSLCKNQRFESFQQWSNFLEKYCTKERLIFRVKRSDKLYQDSYKSPVNLDLLYRRLHYKCKFGDDSDCQGKGIRETRYCC